MLRTEAGRRGRWGSSRWSSGWYMLRSVLVPDLGWLVKQTFTAHAESRRNGGGLRAPERRWPNPLSEAALGSIA